MRPGRIVMLVLGTLSALLGLGLLAGAAGAGWANSVQCNNGYFTTPTERFTANSYALSSPPLDVIADGRFSGARPVNVPGSIVIRGSAADAARTIFIGIAPQAEVAAYLAGVRHTEIVDVRFAPFRALYREVTGVRAPLRPAGQSFWTASASGPGTQELKWDLRSGNWAVVIMNADAGTPVAVDLQAGARTDLLWPIFIGLLTAGLLFLVVGVPLIVAGAAGLGRGGPRPSAPGPAGRPGQTPGAAYGAQGSRGQTPAGQPTSGPLYASPPFAGAALAAQSDAVRSYPARLTGNLDPNVSRWLWLVKWLLAIPHFIVLFFLWFAVMVVTIVAWFAILFTGRYPRSLFNFSVGVIRWSWRVSFYAYGALGTDRYPPFTLARTDYPADFDVDYPERLSRGLVLVKSWLLAIPHLLIVAVLTGTAQTWVMRDGEWVRQSVGISLLGLLVFIAGVILLFTGKYWPGLFDLLLGLNRWIYRVVAYVALMRDEYPPFRLDLGPAEPGHAQALPPSGLPAGPPAATPPVAAADSNPVSDAGPGAPAGGRDGFYGGGGPAASVRPEDHDGTGGPGGPDAPPETGPTAPPRP
ncbi:DUF4389 domain-containing protein [Arthrobacter sp. UYCu712]|uniref:DUF4389 domain-containing protein n=1 Tax=Arthrobacter sp. UYCu712 TaxID=3156340 RepID=UPI00339416BE